MFLNLCWTMNTGTVIWVNVCVNMFLNFCWTNCMNKFCWTNCIFFIKKIYIFIKICICICFFQKHIYIHFVVLHAENSISNVAKLNKIRTVSAIQIWFDAIQIYLYACFGLLFRLITILVPRLQVPLLRIQMTYRGYQSIGCISQNIRVENNRNTWNTLYYNIESRVDKCRRKVWF